MLVIVTPTVELATISTDAGAAMGAFQTNDAFSRPPVGVVSVMAHVRPAGIPARTTGAAMVKVEKEPLNPVPQSYTPENVLEDPPM